MLIDRFCLTIINDIDYPDTRFNDTLGKKSAHNSDAADSHIIMNPFFLEFLLQLINQYIGRCQ